MLRAKDIIPGSPVKKNSSDGASRADIPQFDLAEDIMAEQRRLIAGRRKGPGGPACPSPPVPRPFSVAVPPEAGLLRRMNLPLTGVMDDGRWTSAAWDHVIADIVARDIERLCAPLRQ